MSRLHRSGTYLNTLGFLISTAAASAADPKVDFAKEVQPIFAESCLKCHGAPDPQDPRKKTAGNLRLDDKIAALKGGKSGKAIVPGKAKDSLLYKLLLGPTKVAGREIPSMPKAMGSESSSLPPEKIEIIKKWIDQGAQWAKEKQVGFADDVLPILTESCVKCHGAPDPKDPRKKTAGNLRLDDKIAALKGGKSGKAIVPGKAKDSLLYKLLLGPTKVGGREIPAMPRAMGGESSSLPPEKIEIIKKWIDQGAR